MKVKEFEKKLKKLGKTNGGIFQKADFHIHSPESKDYEYKNPDAIEQLGQVLRENDYRFAIILDHQKITSRETLTELQKYCPKTRLIPGAEINVIVDTMFKKVSKDHFFHCIVAIDPQEEDYNYVLRKAKDDLKYKNNGFVSNIIEIGEFFIKEGAIFIPAHLHQSKPPHESRSIDDIYDDDAFLGFIHDNAFSAIEVR